MKRKSNDDERQQSEFISFHLTQASSSSLRRAFPFVFRMYPANTVSEFPSPHSVFLLHLFSEPGYDDSMEFVEKKEELWRMPDEMYSVRHSRRMNRTPSTSETCQPPWRRRQKYILLRPRSRLPLPNEHAFSVLPQKKNIIYIFHTIRKSRSEWTNEYMKRTTTKLHMYFELGGIVVPCTYCWLAGGFDSYTFHGGWLFCRCALRAERIDDAVVVVVVVTTVTVLVVA